MSKDIDDVGPFFKPAVGLTAVVKVAGCIAFPGGINDEIFCNLTHVEVANAATSLHLPKSFFAHGIIYH
jgi:hypothetical protein